MEEHRYIVPENSYMQEECGKMLKETSHMLDEYSFYGHRRDFEVT
jgi:hypothetical protein